MLDVSNLSVSYGQHRALESAALRVGKGEIVVILGANGAGKSTLLKAIAGISEGRVTGTATLDGEDLIGRKPNHIVEAGLALVPEGRGVFADLTVQENLLLGAYAERARDEEAGNLDRVFTLFPKLAERRKQTVRTMSGGEQQMVAIGRAMMSNPSVLGLDEPSLGLSPLLCKDLFQSLRAVRETGLGVLLVEQNARQSLKIADRGYLLENGEIVHEGTGEALARDPAVQKAYLGGAAAAAAKPAAAPVPKPTPRPASGPSPRDIAAAALQQVAAPKPAAPASPPPTPAPAPVTNGATREPASPVAKPAPSGSPDVADLVARASAKASRRPNGARPNVGAHAPTSYRRNTDVLPTSRFQPETPDLDRPSADRLRSILDDIEAAARRAETYRPPGRRS